MALGKYKGIIDIKLYKMNQEETAEYIKGILDIKGVEYTEDEYGNIYGAPHEGKPLFSAHMDTIDDATCCRVPLGILDGKLMRAEPAVLGADCRAGINIILNHIEDVNFAFFKDEEIGCLGSKFAMETDTFVEVLNKCTFVAVLDRRNAKDILGNKHGYCNEELSKALLEVMPGYKDVSGILCDLDQIQSTLQGVNISVGYMNAHTATEYLVLEDYKTTNDLIPAINAIEIEGIGYDKPVRTFHGRYGGMWGGYSYDYKKDYECETCGADSYSRMSTVEGVMMCSHCVEKFCTIGEF